MKNRSVIKGLALLLAIMLTGVFPVLAETYLEYSGGLSAADARAVLAADANTVNVTVQMLGIDGTVLESETYPVDYGDSLEASAYSGFDSQYKWYDEDGNQIDDLASRTFTEDTTVTTKPTAYTANDVHLNFLVYLDDQWKVIDTDESVDKYIYGPYNDRYLVTAKQLEAAFADYGFSEDSYIGTGDYRIGYDSAWFTTIWADTTPFRYYDSWAVPMGHTHMKDNNVYYLPNNKSKIEGTDRTVSTIQDANAFYTLTLKETSTGPEAKFYLLKDENISEFLASKADVTPTGWSAPLGAYNWFDADGDALEASAAITAATTLTGQPKHVTLTLTDTDGNTLATIEPDYGASLSDWLADNDDLVLSNGKTVHEYTWKLPNDTAITDQVLTVDRTIIGTEKPVYTVTFVADKETGGAFRDASASYTTIQVLAGDCIPSDFFSKMRANLQMQDEYAFVEWRYAGNDGFLVMNASTPITGDTEVWAEYTQQVHVYFWTDRTQAARFPNTGSEQYPVGSLYEGDAPTDADIAVFAPAEGMRFRYWMDLNTGMVFTLETDRVEDNLDLYPVYERAIFSFVSAEGEELDTMYDGDPLNYEATAPEGQYFAGLEVTREVDGVTSTIVIPNGTKISREYLTTNGIPLGTPTDGRYTITATPVYKPQRTVVYHTGDGAQFILSAALNQSTHTVTVNDRVMLLGALDIVNTVSPIGLALDGWTTEVNGTTAQFAPSQTFTTDAELDTLVEAGETVHLYPIWAQQNNTIAITFESNYPDGAVDKDGNALKNTTYTVYIKDGTKPTMPSLSLAGMTVPSDTYTDADGKTQQRYVLAGWSLDDDGNLANNGSSVDTTYTELNGTYTVGSQYLHSVTEEKIFYAIWVDKNPGITTDATFHIRLDGTIPVEPSQHGQSSYLPGACSGSSAWTGTIKKPLNVVNNVAEVEANIQAEPDIDTIYTALKNSTAYADRFANLTAADYGTLWSIDWYACKYSCGSHYHVDGRVRFANEVELNYHPNGGANVPAGTTHTKDTWATISYSPTPTRENFTFIGWDTDPNAKVPDYPVSGAGTNQIFMSTDKDLYAIWQPNKITIPMDEDFQGKKYEQTNTESQTAPKEGRTYQFTIEAISLPTGAAPYPTQTATSGKNGSFTFPRIDVAVPGMYVFEVREVLGDLAVQYDTSVYRLTINIVESEYGLGIAGYSFTKDNVIIPVTNNDVNKVVFEFTNRTDIRSVTATKKWDDGDDQDGLRPDSVSVTLRCRTSGLIDETVTLSAANNWTHTWEKLPIKDENGTLYEYFIIENAVPGYETTYSGNMNSGLVVTNTHVPKTVTFDVRKQWNDDLDDEGYRPDSLTYTLTGTLPNQDVVQNISSGEVRYPWTYTFADMPVYHLGQPITYKLTENEVPGYATNITHFSTGDGLTIFTVTNTLQVASATVTKQITGNAASRDAEFAFTAKVFDASGALVTDLPAGTGYTVDADGTLHFTLGHDGQVKLDMLPLGGSILLSEESSGYEVSWSDGGTAEEGGMRYSIAKSLAVTVTNSRNVEVPTGVALDYVPSLLLMGLALLGLAGLQIRRRRV